MIETLISSKTRIKLLLKFFLNSETSSYLRGLEAEFGESTNAIRVELNRLEKAGMLQSYSKGNKRFFQANRSHPLFGEIHNIVKKHIGFDKIVEQVIERLGRVQKVYVCGDFAMGKNSPIIDLVFVGDIDKNYLLNLVGKTEKLIKRKIRFLIYDPMEKLDVEGFVKGKPLLLWTNEE